MTTRSKTYGFTAGEISEKFFSRTDLDKYGLGLSKARNVIIDFRGGVFSRPPMEFLIGPISTSAGLRFWAFQVANDAPNSYIILINTDTIRFIQNGAYVQSGGANYTIPSVWGLDDLPLLNFEQFQNSLRITCPGRRARVLTRIGHTNWTLTTAQSGSNVTRPSGLSTTPSGVGTAGAGYAVTAVSSSGEESYPSQMHIEEASVNITTTEGYVSLTWNAVPDALFYNVYRTTFASVGSAITQGEELGFLGRAFGPQFTDTNIIPDFTKSPPIGRDPLANSPIETIQVTSAGTGYAKTDTVSITDPDGTGFTGFPVINDAGEVLGVVISTRGRGYTSPTVVFNTSTGSGAAATVTVGAAGGNNPRASTIFQQRQVFAGSDTRPLELDASRVGQYENFDVGLIPTAEDAYTLAIDTQRLTPITNMISMQAGLLLFSESLVSFLTGNEGEGVSTLNYAISPASFFGAARTTPLKVGQDVLYASTGEDIIYALRHNGRRQFSLAEVSTYFAHLLSQKFGIVRWAWAESPHRLLIGVRKDGRVIAVTYRPDEKIWAAALWKTEGEVKDVVSVRENGEDRVYFITQRRLGGNTSSFYIERMTFEDPETIEDQFYLDCGLRSEGTAGAGELTLNKAQGTVTIRGVGTNFNSFSVGDILYTAGGKAEITAISSATQMTVSTQISFTDFLENGALRVQAEGEWEVFTKFSSFTGLNHLNGVTVTALADGQVIENLAVDGGKVDLPIEAAKVSVGLPYTQKIDLLPSSALRIVADGRLRRAAVSDVRVRRTRGMRYGVLGKPLDEMRGHYEEGWNVGVNWRSEVLNLALNSGFDREDMITFQQHYPLRMEILGLTLNIDYGDPDDPD